MATSGVISTNTKYGSCFWVKWEISGSQSISDNKTTIAWSCGLTPGEQYYDNAIKMSAVSIAGVKVYDGGTYSNITDYKDRTFASGTLELSHNADGTKSFTVAAFSGWLYGNGDYTAAAKSFTLPTIPRATTPSIGPVTIGGKATISLPRASTAFTHTLSYSFGSASGTIATKAGSSYTWTVPESLAAQITSKLSGTGTLTCKTYKGSSLVGTKSVSFTAAVPGSMKPALSAGWVTVTYDNSGTKASAIAAWVQGYSKAKATFYSSKVTCKQGATVKKYSITYLGKTVSASPYRTGTITATSAKVRCTVTDSRGLTAYEDFSITLLAYAKPALNGVKLYRSDAEGKAADSGTHIAGVATAKYSSLGGKNRVTIKGYWKSVGGSYGSGVAMQAGTAKVISGSTTLSTEKSYTAKVIATDSLGNTATYEATIPTEKVAFHLKAGGDGAAFGKAAEKSKALELAADWNLHAGRFIYMGGSKATNAEKDIYFQTMDGAANPHNTTIYGGNGESAVAWGVYDAQNKRSVIRYDDEAGTLRLLGFTPAGITISASGSYLKNFSGTAKHISALSMGILRVYGETNVAMPAGTTYDVASIGDHLPTSVYAMSAYCLKNLDARLSSAGTIQIRPKEDIPAGYGIYIAGIWIAS